MRRLIVALIAAGLLALVTAVPAFAQGPPTTDPTGGAADVCRLSADRAPWC